MDSFLPISYTTASPSLTDDEFNLFHSIDRKLYTRLIINLGRDPNESVLVLAFWLWREKEVVDNLTMVNQMLSLPPPLLKELADESVMCLICVESDTFPFGEDTHELVLLPNFVERNISLEYFHQNRIEVLRGISRMIGEVCSRAFRDLFVETIRGTGFFPVVIQGSRDSISEKGSHGGVKIPPLVGKVGETSSFCEVGNCSDTGVAPMIHTPVNDYPCWFPYYPMPPSEAILPIGGGSNVTENQIMENKLTDMVSSKLKGMEEENDDVFPLP